MPRPAGCFEQHTAVELWCHALDFIFLRRRPRIFVELNCSAPVFLPLVVEINNQIESSMGTGNGMFVEVDVGVEILAMTILVRASASAEVMRIVEQVGYTRNLPNPFEE